MAKKTTKEQAALAAPAPVVVNPFGETEHRKIVRYQVQESIFTLDDGTKLVVRPLVSDIRRAVGQYDSNGQPIYFLTLGQNVRADAPKKLRRPAVAKKAKR